MGGNVARAAPAITTPYRTELGLPVIPPKMVANPAGKVRVRSLLVTMKGHKKLFQLAIKVKIMTAVMAGPGKRRRPTPPKTKAEAHTKQAASFPSLWNPSQNHSNR